jgi:hypothetical protein
MRFNLSHDTPLFWSPHAHDVVLCVLRLCVPYECVIFGGRAGSVFVCVCLCTSQPGNGTHGSTRDLALWHS